MDLPETARGKWIAGQIAGAFKEQGVQQWQAENLLRGQDFLALLGVGQANTDALSRLFVHFQPREGGNPNPVLFVSTGEKAGKIEGKALFFLRNTPAPEAPIDLSRPCDETLLSGEVTADLLTSLQSTVEMFKPAIEVRADYGLADQEAVSSFKEEMAAFSLSLDESVEAIEQSSVHLRRPDRERVDFEAVSRELFTAAGAASAARRGLTFSPTEVVHLLEEIVAEWIAVVQSAVDAVGSGTSSSSTASGAGLVEGDASFQSRSVTMEELADAVPHSEGPLGVLRFWRERAQGLTSLVEQLKTRECRQVLTILTALLSRDTSGVAAAALAQGGRARLPPVAAPPTPVASVGGTAPTFALGAPPTPVAASAAAASAAAASSSSSFAVLRRWKSTDAALTQAFNEAKDNYRYLSSLGAFFKPLYYSPAAANSEASYPKQVSESLPALLSAVKGVGLVSRFFGTSKERMTDLMLKTTLTIIAGCKEYLLSLPSSSPSLFAGLRDPKAFLWIAAAPPAAKTLAPMLTSRMEEVLRLNEAFQSSFAQVMRKEEEASSSAAAAATRVELNEDTIFRPLDSFCRRVLKLIDLVAITTQLNTLVAEEGSLDVGEDIGPILQAYRDVLNSLKGKRHDLLQHGDSGFDRDYVATSMAIGERDTDLQRWVDRAFAATPSIAGALSLLEKLQVVLQRESLRETLEGRALLLFERLGSELEKVETEYERHKAAPPLARDLPPVSGAILWSRNLRKRVEEPMTLFQRRHAALLHTKEARRVVRRFVIVQRCLRAFEDLWLKAYTDSIPSATDALQATLLVKHPIDGQLYVNLDQGLVQTIKEARMLDRLVGRALPETARILLLREASFKRTAHELQRSLDDYRRLRASIVPVVSSLIYPALVDIEWRLRPGLTTLTWSSVSVDAFLQSVASGLSSLETLLSSSQDILKNRVERRLKEVSRAVLVHLPSTALSSTIDSSGGKGKRSSRISLETFLSANDEHASLVASRLQAKSEEIEAAVEDLLNSAAIYPLSHPSIARATQAERDEIRSHYQRFFVSALFSAVKTSLHALRARLVAAPEETVGSNSSGSSGSGALFEVAVRLQAPRLAVSSSSSSSFLGVPAATLPPQGSQHHHSLSLVGLHSSASSCLSSAQSGYFPPSHFSSLQVETSDADPSSLFEDEDDDDEAAENFRNPLAELCFSPSLEKVQAVVNCSSRAVLGATKKIFRWGAGGKGENKKRQSLYPELTDSLELARVVLLLAGSVGQLKERAFGLLGSFHRWAWLYRESPAESYQDNEPKNLDDWREMLERLAAVEEEIATEIRDRYVLGALSLPTATLKAQLTSLVTDWKRVWLGGLHSYARARLSGLSETIKSDLAALQRPVEDLDALRFAMLTLQSVRAKEATIERDEIAPVFEAYALLEYFLSTLPASGGSGGIAAGSAASAVAALSGGVGGGDVGATSRTAAAGGPGAFTLGSIPVTELDDKSMLRPLWSRVKEKANDVAGVITRTQHSFKIQLLRDVAAFVHEAQEFRESYLQHGFLAPPSPTQLLEPYEAMERF